MGRFVIGERHHLATRQSIDRNFPVYKDVYCCGVWRVIDLTDRVFFAVTFATRTMSTEGVALKKGSVGRLSG